MFETLSSSIQKVFSKWGRDRTLTEENIRGGLEEIREALLEADVHFQVARDLIAEVEKRAVGVEVIESVEPAQQIIKTFDDVLREAMEGDSPALPAAKPGQPTIVMMVGLQGSGKTTTCAKLALKYKKMGRRPMMVAADVQRPAAAKQLQVLGERLDIPVHADPGGSPPSICADAIAKARKQGDDVVLLDTAGRLHIDEPLMKELEEVAKKAPPNLVYLVCDSMAGQDAYTSAKEFHGRLQLDALVLTKLDGDSRGGAAISVRKVTGKPVAWIGTGEGLTDLDPFHADRLASRILGMGDVVSLVEKAEEVMDEKEAEKAAERLFKNQFTFDDFLGQLKALRKMGPLAGLLKMLPGGMGKALDSVGGVQEKDLKRVEAIIQSMTPTERKRPDTIDASRKRRIAKGAGSEISGVNQLLRQFDQLRKMMKSMGGAGMMNQMNKIMGGGGPAPSLGGIAPPPRRKGPAAPLSSPENPIDPRMLNQLRIGSAVAEEGDKNAGKKDRKRQKQARRKNRRRR